MRWLLPLILFGLVLFPPAASYAGGTRVSATVMPFVELKGDEGEWLGKAISDMVALKLSDSGDFDVLERDRLQSFIKEMDLQQSGFTDGDVLKRIGGLAKVDSVIYGNYAVDGNKLVLNLLEMNVAGQKILYRASSEGAADDLQDAVSRLVTDYLKKRGTEPEGEDAGKVAFRVTDSTPAIQHFYQGIDFYDKGKYEDAYGEFLAASQADSKYLDARLWAGRMLEYTAQPEQAELAYKKLYDAAALSVEGRDALYFAARLLEEKSPDTAAAYYKTLADIMPKVPESLAAAYRAGVVLEKQGKYADAYRALQSIQDFREEADKLVFQIGAQEFHEERQDFFGTLHSLLRLVQGNRHDLSPENIALMSGLTDLKMRQSRFFSWDAALALYRGTVLQMVELYRRAEAQAPDLKPPRGVFAVDPKNPVIAEAHYGDTKSLFFKDTKIVPQWSENFYAAIIPEGYTATGVTLHVTGRVPQPAATTDFTLRVFGFPIPRNYFNSWLGVIYGQTQETTSLQKEIPFHGHDHDILVFQLIENRGEIKDWKVEFRLRPKAADEKAPPPVASKGDFEGAETARLAVDEDAASGVAEPQYIEQYGNKKRLALAQVKGGLWLVAAKGSLAAGETDLWAAHSADGKAWGKLARMDVNGQSNDFAPQLVASEDGGARLFWISDRRGQGWELWTSKLGKDGENWSQPLLIPLGKYIPYIAAPNGADGGNFLEFSAAQDAQGRWLVAACANTQEGGIGIVSSKDGETWEFAGSSTGAGRMFDPVLFQDSTQNYWLGAIDGGAMLQLVKSEDLKKWDAKKYPLGSYSRHWSQEGNGNYGSVFEIEGYPLTLADNGDGRLALLFSDTMTGLQYARFRPDTEQPAPDLVRNVTLEPYAAAQTGKGGWTVAAWQGDDIILRSYRNFSFPDNDKNDASDPLYHETEIDTQGNRWDRRIARTRYVMSDVTAVGAAPDGRAWWGIETGVMSLKGDDFYVADVSMGFFYHQATDIVPCGDKTWFAARTLDEPVLGVISEGVLTNKTEKITLPELKTGITAIACGAGGNIIVGTAGGDVALVAGSDIVYRQHVEDVPVTAVAAQEGGMVAGTAAGNLYRVTEKSAEPLAFQAKGKAFAVTGIAAADGALWVSTAGGGAYLRRSGSWQQFTPENSTFPYAAPGKIRAQGDGIWFMPDNYTLPRGIGYFDGKTAVLYDPPSHAIFDPIDFDVASDGSVWLGSESSGIYRLERKK